MRSKAVEVLNALLKDGMAEGKAIPIALSRAREFVKNHAATPTMDELMAKCKKDHPDWTPAQHKAWAEEQMKKHSEYAEQHTNAIRGIEVFAAGTHNGDVYTEADLDEMVRAHGELDFRPALKVGHTKDSPGAPAYGWVRNLRRVGQKLVADFTDMHDSVVDAIRKRAYDRVSSEVYFNLNRGGKKFGRALKAVALLGADVPAVAGLVPLHKVEFATDGEFEKFTTAHEAALDVPQQAVFECLNERASALIRELVQKEHSMKTAKQLQEELDALTERLDAIGRDGADDKEKTAQVKELSEAITKVSAEIKALTAADETERTEMAATLKASNERIAQLEADARRRSVAEKVASIRVPAFRPGMEAVYAYALTHAAEKVRVYSKDDKGNERSEEKTLVEIADVFVAQINSQAEKLFKTYTRVDGMNREEGSLDDPAEDPGVAIDRKVREYMAKNPTVKDYEVAMDAVRTIEPELFRRYTEAAQARASAH